MSDIPPISNTNYPQGQPIPDKVRKRKDKYSQSESIQKTHDLEQIEHYVAKLLNSSDIRPEMVALGKKLALARDFPSSDNLDKLAEALLSPIDDIINDGETS